MTGQTAGIQPKATKAQMRADRIYGEMRRRICLLDYPPGRILREHDLANEFEVSRTPVRRVLHWLERDGLVESRPGLGTRVTSLDLEDLLDTYLLRVRLSASIGETRVVPPNPQVFNDLKRLTAVCEELADGFDLRRFGEVNIGLHTNVLAIIGSPALRETLDYLFYQTTRLWFELLDEANWQQEVADLRQESQELWRALALHDYRAVGLIRSNRISGVAVRMRLRAGGASVPETGLVPVPARAG
jgi:DNA-binding GntR family transcriptional regulator